ncbi:tyrosine-protein phosphatase non-receptor type 23 [Bombina bombina]|uniref:tyrosine-protein phosphatase non-receptor type 23 n=1 Tax=Bombina bombina TaxID=8345 RepID=UPI00235A8F96|nr:tyrosine-protein phosphatase non-receptor type 23 [Bombina bombina]
MEAVPRMPMIWLDLKEPGEFGFNQAVKQFVLKNYSENPENYNDELKKLEQLRQSAVNVPRDFEGCSVLRKYFGQLHYLQSRIPMGFEQEAAVPISWTEIFSGKTVTHKDIKYEQACVLYNLGALHSMLGAMDKRVSEEGMKVSCTHFQCAAGAFAYLRDHFAHSYSVDMSHQILNLNINLMLGQAQECLLEKSMLDNRKSFLVARISAQVVDYYKEACRALENSETASLLGKIQKDWKKLVQMKIYYFASIAHLHMGKQAEEQQKYGEQVAYLQSALDKLNEAIKQSKGQPTTVQDALRFAMDVIGGKFNSAKKDNDFIYHESVPALETLQAVKGAPLVKALPVNPTDPAVTGPDIFCKLVPMAAHEASSLYSEEKAKLLRDIMLKIEAKNEVLDQFTDSLQLDPDTVDNLDLYSHISPALMEKCAALSVRPDTVKSLVQSMQVLSGVYTDVEASLKDIKDLIDEEENQEQKLQEELGKQASPPTQASPSMAEVSKEWAKYMEVHEKASFTNTELHKAMNLHISNLRLLSGPLDQLQQALPAPSLTEDDKAVLQNLKRVLSKVHEMREQRRSLEQQLRDTIQKDDITTSLVTTDRSEMKKMFAEQLKKYDQLKVYIDQNLLAQDNILKALTEANVKYAPLRKVLTETEQKWNHTVQTLISSYEAYEDLMKKSQEGKDFYDDLECKVAKLLEKSRAASDASQANRQQILEREMKKKPPPRPTAPKPSMQKKPSDVSLENFSAADLADIQHFSSLLLSDLPEELKSLPPDALAAHFDRISAEALGLLPMDQGNPYGVLKPPGIPSYIGGRTASAPMPDQPRVPFNHLPRPFPQYAPGAIPGPQYPPATFNNNTQLSTPSAHIYPGGAINRAHINSNPAPTSVSYNYPPAALPQQRISPQHMPVPVSTSAASQFKPNAGTNFGMGQQISSPGLPHNVINQSVPVQPHDGSIRFHSPIPGSSVRPQVAQGVGPATTTVDSIQGPISSYTTPRLQGPVQPGIPLNNHPMNQPMTTSQSSYIGQQPRPVMGPPVSFPYPQIGMQNYVQQPQTHLHQPPAPQMFHPTVHNQPRMDMQTRALSISGQMQYVPSAQPTFTGQMQAPSQTTHPLVYQPQRQPLGMPPVTQLPPQQNFQHQNQFPPQRGIVPPQQNVQSTVHPQLGPQQYPVHHQDKLPQQVLPPPPCGVNLHSALPRVSPQSVQTIPSSLVQPSPSMHPHPAATVMQSLPPGSTAQIPPTMPFAPHAASQMSVGGPQTTPSVPRHMQPPISPAISQLPGSVIVSGSSAIPSPAPSPQPSLVAQPPAVLPSSVPTSSAMPQRPPPALTPGTAPLTHSSNEVVFQRQSSSTDDLLSSSPESQHGGSNTSVGQPLLQPTKADSKDGQKPKSIQLIENDPYEKPEHIMRLLSELDRFRVVVEALDKPVPGSATQLDSMWKEFQDAQEKEARQLSIAIARCYTMKNRHQDIMPYDKNRIILQSGKDDYINASKIEDLSSYCPTIIATQAPLVGTASDFWLMIHEQKVSLIVMLVSELEFEKQKVMRYFPMERGQPMVHGHITLTLTSQKVTSSHVERVIALQYKDQSLKRSIIHLQFTSWPELGLPDSKGNLLRFIQEVHSHYLHQRPLHTPIVVHCSSGVGRTGAFCLMYAAMQEVEAGNGIPNLAELVKKMRQQRKHMLQEKLHLKFCYEAVLKHVELVLQRHGVNTPSASKPQPSLSQKIYSVQDPQDIVLGGDMPISSIQATIAKLSIKPYSGGTETLNHYLLPEPLFDEQPPGELLQPAFPLDVFEPDLTLGVSTEQEPSKSQLSQDGSSISVAETVVESHNHHPVMSGKMMPTAEPSAAPVSVSTAPSSSSMNLLASLTPETFSLDSSQRGKQKMNKQSFLHPQNGGVLARGTEASGDPLSMLDPLWTLNKT